MKKRIAVITSAWSFDYLKQFFDGMQAGARDKNIDIYVFTYYNYTENTGFFNNTGANIFSIIDYKSFDGVVILASLFYDDEVVEKERLRIIESGIPAITVNKRLEGLTYLNANTQAGLKELINHLIKEHNVTDLRFIGGNPVDPTSQERFETYKQTLSENNIPFDESKCFLQGDWSFDFGYNCALKLFEDKSTLPQGIFCANDMGAVGVLKAAHDNGIKIPEQVKLISFDNVGFSKYIYPSITTVDSNTTKAGSEAIKHFYYSPESKKDIIVDSTGIIRQSCGCEKEVSDDQKNYIVTQLNNDENSAKFTSHLQEIENVFLDSQDVYSLLTNLSNYFSKDNSIESSDFALFLKSDWTSILINNEEELPENLDFGKQMQSIINIRNGKKCANEIIDIKQFIPENMKSNESNLYLILPIYYHTYIHGYYVSKNNVTIIHNKHAFLWASNLSNAIERFRQKNMFKHMSQQYLKLSTRDGLSGMLNRIGMEKLAEPFYRQNQQENLTNILLFADINSMKTINDKFGHLHGDLAIKTIAEAVLSVIPKTWYAIRYGGDEFLVIGNNKDYHGENFCKMIAEIIEKKNIMMRLPYRLSASLGFFTVPPTTKITLAQAISKVDEAMYLKKQAYHKLHPGEERK